MIPTTSSQSEPPTANAEPDQPQTDKPDGDMSMPNPSKILITSSLIGGQISSSMVVSTPVTATATVANILPATASSIETSVRSRALIIAPHPMSTEETILSSIDTFTSTQMMISITTESPPVATVMSVVSSTGEPDLSINLSLLPTSTTANIFSIERPPPDQSETGGTGFV